MFQYNLNTPSKARNKTCLYVLMQVYSTLQINDINTDQMLIYQWPLKYLAQTAHTPACIKLPILMIVILNIFYMRFIYVLYYMFDVVFTCIQTRYTVDPYDD